MSKQRDEAARSVDETVLESTPAETSDDISATPDEDAESTDSPDKTPNSKESSSGLKAWLGRPRTARMRMAVALSMAVVVVVTGGFFWLQSGRSVLGVRSGQGVFSVLPTWLPDNVAFSYGDRDVTVDELNGEVQTLHALYGVEVPNDEQGLASFRKDSAKAYGVNLVLDQAANDNGIVVSDKTARDTLSKFVQEKLGNGPDAYNQFVAALGQQGTTEQAVIDELKRRLALGQLFNKITGNVSAPNDQTVGTAFDQRKQSLATPEKRQVSNIVLKTKEDADGVMAALRKGVPFDAVAQQVSLDGSTRDKKGDLGALTRNQLEKNYGDAAFGTPPGQVFGPVQTQFGWNVGRVGSITPSMPADFAQVKEPLRQRLQTEDVMTRWRGWLGDRIENADIRYADEYRPAHPDSAPENPPNESGMPRNDDGK